MFEAITQGFQGRVALKWTGVAEAEMFLLSCINGLKHQTKRTSDIPTFLNQLALIHGLRYNRFLLDEALAGREQRTPLQPIIQHCLERGEKGQRMLVALRDWWQNEKNDVGMHRHDTISPIPEGIPLMEAERIARQREPGDRSSQRSVVEQINMSLQ